jgi:hypothetical protein
VVGGFIGTLVSALAIFLVIALVWPDFFRLVGLGPLTDWLATRAGRRIWTLVPMVFALMMANLVQQGYTRAARKGRSPFGRPTDDSLGAGPRTLEAGGWKGGVETGARAPRWLLSLDTGRTGSSESTRLRAAVAPRRDFHLALMPQSGIIKVMTSPRIGGFLLGLGRNSAFGTPQEEAQRRAMDELSFIVGPAIELGEPEFDHAFLIKSDDEGAARALLGDLRGPLLALRRPDRWWQLTLTSSVAEGRGMLEYSESGVVRDAPRLDAVQQVMTRMLERLASQGLIAEAGPSSNA